MIKVDICRKKTNGYFSGAILDLFPKTIVFTFKTKQFTINYDEVVRYSYHPRKFCDIEIEFKNIRENLKIVVKPYTSQDFEVIRNHLDQYCKNRLEYVVNPIFNSS